MGMRLKRQAMLYCAGLLLTAAAHGGVFAPCSAQTRACAPGPACAISVKIQGLSAEAWPSKFYAEVERAFVETLDRTYVRGVARTGAFLVRHILFVE